MLLSIHPKNPQPKHIETVNKVLENGGSIIYPTDTVYGLGCSLERPQAIKAICRIRNLDPRKANLSIVCRDLKQLSSLAHHLNKPLFKALKRNIPGPFTFILKSARALPKQLRNRKETLGFRIIDHPIVDAILERHGHPLMSISFRDEEDDLLYPSDPEEIHDFYHNKVDLVINGGMGNLVPSTILDCTDEEIKVLRQGAGDFIEG